MSRLEDFGITTQRDSRPKVNDREISLDPSAFFGQAAELLHQLRPVVLTDTSQTLTGRAGRWHPSGFMVYALGTHEHLGTLRLHIWPSGPRRAEERPDGLTRDIHDHVMHIASIVVAGDYSDTIYDVETRACAETHARAADEYRVYVPAEGIPAATTLVSTTTLATAHPRLDRRFVSGTVHTIEAGDFHVPTIPRDHAVATLVFSSPRVNPVGPHVLVAGDEPSIEGEAHAVTPDEASLASRQIN